MAAVTARIDKPQRAHGKSSVERAPSTVTATFVDQVEPGIYTSQTSAEELDAELHRNNSNAGIVLIRRQSAERQNEAQQAKTLDLDRREQLKVID